MRKIEICRFCNSLLKKIYHFNGKPNHPSTVEYICKCAKANPKSEMKNILLSKEDFILNLAKEMPMKKPKITKEDVHNFCFNHTELCGDELERLEQKLIKLLKKVGVKFED